MPLAAALTRVLAADVIAPVDAPPFDRSNVDGFAVRAADTAGVAIESGDIALIRTGWGRYFGIDNPRYLQGEPGIDVPGVKGADGEVLRWLSIDQIAEMAKSAIISGGMLPKLGACREALLSGVKRVRILPAEAAASLPDLCSSRVAHGTEVMVA